MPTSAFTNSEDALATFKTDPQAFDLVISDMTMPHLTGDQMAMEVLKDCPDMPIVICTGFSEHISPEKAAEIGIRQLLMKPISKKTLAKAVRQALDTKTDSAPS